LAGLAAGAGVHAQSIQCGPAPESDAFAIVLARYLPIFSALLQNETGFVGRAMMSKLQCTTFWARNRGPMQSPLAGVLAETDQLFTELDVTKQLRDNSLEGAADGETPAVEMDEAA